MRMRKKKWAEPYLEAHSDLALADPSVFKGQWHELLQCEKLHVELGMGKGDYLIRMSRMYPSDGWVGVEKDRSAAATALRKGIEEEGADWHNRRMIAGNAEDLEQWFAEGEIDVLHLNFSDPWPKKYTHKRRLSSGKFLGMYKKLLKEDGIVQMKTDNKGLFEDSVLYFLHGGFMIEEFSVDYRREEHPEDAVTEYESRFLELGQPIYRMCVRPCRRKEDMLE